MPYTDWNYTNPGWTNENPPAINESNLNDISNSLEKFFVHWWKKGNIVQEDIVTSQKQNVFVHGTVNAGAITFNIYQTISYDLEEKKYVYSNPLSITVNNGASLSNYSGYYVYPSLTNDTSVAYKISDETTIRVSVNAGTVDDTTVVGSSVNFNCTGIVCSNTKDFPDYGQQGDYFYIYIGIPVENALDRPAIISYLGSGTNSIQIDVGGPFNAVIWANWEIGGPPIIIHQKNSLTHNNGSADVFQTDTYTIDGTIINITTGPSNGGSINTAGFIYYLLVV